jgi:hypothetical protein
MLSRLCAGSASEFCLQSMHPAASGSCCTGMSSRHACTTSIKVKALAPSTQASPDPYLPKVGNAFGVAFLLGTSILVLARNAGLYSCIAAPTRMHECGCGRTRLDQRKRPVPFAIRSAAQAREDRS